VTRLPVVVVAVLAAMVTTAAALKWANGYRRRAATSPLAPAALQRAEHADPGLAAPSDGDDPIRSDSLGTLGARMLHGDPRHTHRALGIAPQSPVVVWQHDVGGPVEAQVSTSSDERTLYVATLGGALTALAAVDGKELWSVGLGDRGYATPCVADDGVVFVGSDARKLTAISPEGKVRWSLDTDGDADTAPAIAPDGSVVFSAGTMVYDVTPRGLVKWRFSARRKVFTSPAIGPQGRIFVGSQDHHAYALSPDGRPLWSVDLGSDVDGTPAIGDDGAAFFGTDGGEVVRIDPDDGRVVWRTRLGGYVRGALSISRSGGVFAGVYGPRPRMVGLRALDGSLIVEFTVPGTGSPDFGVHGGPTEDSAGTLLFGAQDDKVYAVDPDGKLLWRFSTGGDVDAPITLLGDGTAVVASDDGIVRALRAPR